jgi:ATP-dependent exoDNAse (exonuclease V) beta subunit
MTTGERRLAERLDQGRRETIIPGDMTVVCADTKTCDLCACALAQRKLPVENRLGIGDFDPISNKIKVMTMKVSKGLEFPVVALPGVGVLCGGYSGDAEVAREAEQHQWIWCQVEPNKLVIQRKYYQYNQKPLKN